MEQCSPRCVLPELNLSELCLRLRCVLALVVLCPFSFCLIYVLFWAPSCHELSLPALCALCPVWDVSWLYCVLTELCPDLSSVLVLLPPCFGSWTVSLVWASLSCRESWSELCPWSEPASLSCVLVWTVSLVWASQPVVCLGLNFVLVWASLPDVCLGLNCLYSKLYSAPVWAVS